MLIPIQHENMSARRWPIITLALIVVNVLCFLLTMSTINKESNEVAVTRMHILMLAANHPELTVKPETQMMIDSVKEKRPGIWKQLASQSRPLEDGWDAQMRMANDQQQFQAEMDRLEEDYARLTAENLTENYGFVPGRTNLISYLTANFLHLGWMHLIGNMWFLWLAGFVLEDTWGRPLYLFFYLLAGVGALQFHAWLQPGSLTPTLGASGAVAGLMGAFLVRFPKIKIEMAWIWIRLIRARMFRFKVPAYALLPLWVGSEVLYGSLFGTSTGVAHWAHVGGFLFGAVFALGVRATGIEKKLTAKVTEQMEFAHDPEIESATESLHSGRLEEALLVLKSFVAKKPESIDGWSLLRQVHWRRYELPSCMEASLKLIRLYAKSGEMQLAEQEFADFIKAGGRRLPSDLWLELARAYEQQREFDRAVLEFENLAKAYPDVRESVQAQVAAAKLCLRELHRAQDALRLYRAASSSAVPHMELASEIEAGIRAASAAVPSFPAAEDGRKAKGAAAGVPSVGESFGVFSGVVAAEVVVPAWVQPAGFRGVAAKISATVIPSKPLDKPATWGKLDAPPVWGHGAKGDRTDKPLFSPEGPKQ